MSSLHLQGKRFSVTVIQVYAPNTNAKEVEIEWFCEDLQDLLELTPKKVVLFIIGDWDAKVGSHETPGVTGKFGLGPITSWEIDAEAVETVSDFILGGSKITADGDCSHEIKRCLLRGRKVMTNLDSIFKSRDITLLTKVHLVKAMVFPVVMYGCKS